MHKGPGVRFNLECVSIKYVPADVESFAYGESFVEGIEDLIKAINFRDKSDSLVNSSGEWFQTYYYTNEDDGYFFYTQEDMDYNPEEEDK